MSDDLFSIVVVGAMNPAIHHAHWYRANDLITEDEIKIALTGAMFLPQFSQFNIGQFDILCQLDRWQIKTAERRIAPRIVNTSLRVFDEILPQTPLSQCGFNFSVASPVDYNAKTALAAALKATSIVGGDICSAEFKGVSIGDAGRRTETLTITAEEEAKIRISINQHFILPTNTTEMFFLRPILERFETLVSAFDNSRETILRNISQYGTDNSLRATP